jgi:hypothetical protein
MVCLVGCSHLQQRHYRASEGAEVVWVCGRELIESHDRPDEIDLQIQRI